MFDPKKVLEMYRKFVEIYPNYNGLIKLDYLPFEYYQVYEKWKPDPVKVLLLAESPSWNKPTYFYNVNEMRQGTLSWNVLSYLRIGGLTKAERLQKFKEHEYFLVDTVKCVFNKKTAKRTSIPTELIEFSVREFLQAEIYELDPKCILVLGSTALKGLKLIDSFSLALSRFYGITDACGKSISVDKVTVIFSLLPFNRNKKYNDRIESAFRQTSLYV